jgi:hypothetical protein
MRKADIETYWTRRDGRVPSIDVKVRDAWNWARMARQVALDDGASVRLHFFGREPARPKAVTDLIRRKMTQLTSDPPRIINGNVSGQGFHLCPHAVIPQVRDERQQAPQERQRDVQRPQRDGVVGA